MQLLQVRKQRWDSYSKGEELFGMPVTKYPGLEKTEEEIQMLDRLYSCVHPLAGLLSSLHGSCLFEGTNIPMFHFQHLGADLLM